MAAADATFDCPECGTPLRVHTTRRPAAGVVDRYRRCPGCGRLFKSQARTVRRGGEVVTREALVPTRRPAQAANP